MVSPPIAPKMHNDDTGRLITRFCAIIYNLLQRKESKKNRISKNIGVISKRKILTFIAINLTLV